MDATRSERRMPGWFAVALGLGGRDRRRRGARPARRAAAVGRALRRWCRRGAHGRRAAHARLARAGSRPRGGAARGSSETQHRLKQLRTQPRRRTRTALADLARLMGYRDSVELMRHWSEYSRMLEDSAPLMRVQDLLSATEAQKRSVLDAARPLLRAAAPGTATPETLERMAHEARRATLARTRLEQLTRSDESADRQRQVLEGAVEGLRERAIRILQGAGLTYDPERTLAEHVPLPHRAHRDAAASHRRGRRADPVRTAAPAARIRARGAPQAAPGAARADARVCPSRDPPVEIDIEVQQSRTPPRGRRSGAVRDLRVEVEEVLRAHAQQRPELEAQLERYRRAAARARRFKQAAELARTTIQEVAVDTHRRWADFLNARVVRPARGDSGRTCRPAALRRGPRLLRAVDGGPAGLARQGAPAALRRRARPALPGGAPRGERVPLAGRRAAAAAARRRVRHQRRRAAARPACAR